MTADQRTSTTLRGAALRVKVRRRRPAIHLCVDVYKSPALYACHRMVGQSPGEDRFTPPALTIRAGDSVRWTNQDTDDHTIVSDDLFNTAGHLGTNVLLPGTDSNNGQPGKFTLQFNHPGTFVYYCRFHAQLDADHQPAAPGPKGGIQDANGNFGTPMMGLITVLPGGENDDGHD